MRPSALLSIALPLLAACSTPSGPPVPTPAEAARAAQTAEVKSISSRAEAMFKTQDELVWKSWTEGAQADLARTYVGSETWLQPTAIATVDRLRQTTTPPLDRRALTHLHAYLVTEWLAQATTELSEAVAKLETTLQFGPAGQERPYRDLERLLTAERSAFRRRILYDSATPAVLKLAEALAQRRVGTEVLVSQLGIPPLALISELRDAELDRLVTLAEEVLTRTQGAFATTLGRLSWTELQLPVERVTRADIPRLFRLQGQDAAFAKSEIYPRATRTLLGLGVDLAAMKSVTVDLKETPGKNPRGLVLGVVVPNDVRVSLLPVGGARDERETMHQMGHLLHDGLSQETRWALAKLGNRTVGEAWSFVLEDLMLDPGWLEAVAGLTGDAQLAWRISASAQRLFLLRRAAGKVLFNAAARAPDADARKIYKNVMERTYGFPMTAADEARAELDREEFLASADYLEAFLLAAQLEQQLQRRFGARWWQEKAAGDWIRRLLAPGTGVSADGLARAIGEDRIAVEAFLMLLPTTLGGTAASAPPTPPAAPDAGSPGIPAPDAGPRPQPAGSDYGL